MSRKPTTQPDINHSENGKRAAWRSPTLRPLGPVPSDRETDWFPLKDALQMLSPAFPKATDAASWLLRHITSGEVSITCRLLTYRKHGARMATYERYEWPGREARLAEQIEHAALQPLSGFHALHGTVDLEWLDVTGDYAVDARMSFPHVDRAALLSFFPKLQELADVERAPPIAAPSKLAAAVAPPSPAESFKDFVKACFVDESSWTVAYAERLQPAQAAGRFLDKSREQFRRAYAEYLPNPKRGRKPADDGR